MKPQTKKAAIFFLFGFVCLNAVILSLFFAKGIHSLKRDSSWLSMKRLSTNCCWPMGTMDFLEQRQVFAGNQLNLSEWHGFNELILNQSLPIEEINFRVKFEPDSYVWIFFLQDHGARYGFRISQNKDMPSGFFKLDNRGKILARQELIFTFPENSWDSVSIKILAKHIQITTGGMYYQILKPDSIARLLSFKTGLYLARVDDLELKDGLGHTLVKDSFSPPVDWRIVAFSFASILLVTLLFGFGFYLRQRNFQWKNVIPLVAMQVIATVILLMMTSFDFYVWSHQYYVELTPLKNEATNYQENKVETWRRDFLNNIESRFFPSLDPFRIDPVVFKMYVRAVGNKPPFRDDELFWYTKNQPVKILYRPLTRIDLKRPKKLIAFMGTSQTWGEGADTRESTFAAQTINNLKLRSGGDVAGINFSMQGVVSTKLLADYKKLLAIIKPDVLVVNLGWNDRAIEEFEASLMEIAELNKSLKIKTVFSHESITSEVPSNYAVKNHLKMSEIAKKHSVQVLKFFEFMSSNSNKDSGLVWWDVIHLNQHGHDQAAQFFTEKLNKLINE